MYEEYTDTSLKKYISKLQKQIKEEELREDIPYEQRHKNYLELYEEFSKASRERSKRQNKRGYTGKTLEEMNFD
ncbi:MAG: hypothetical protein ACOC5T_09765 [Elusimicrobiota bacterium]